jgi:hypothetical protein
MSSLSTLPTVNLTTDQMSQHAQTNLAELLGTLTMREIIAHFKEVLRLSNKQCTKKHLLIAYVVDHVPEESLKTLCKLANEKLKQKGIKNKSHQTRSHSTVLPATVCVEEDSEYDPLLFLRLPTDEEVKNIYGDFYKATSNAALESGVCVVCARETRFNNGGRLGLSDINLTDLPNSRWLIPKNPHPAHNLFDGRLLNPSGVKCIDGQHILSICRLCLDELKKATKSPPRYALANRLWIGHVPWELQVLTFPEQLLVSLLFPRVFVFKLFPKCMGEVQDVSGLQRAMRGNVSLYELDMQGIMSMIEGKLMPRPPVILASLISVTFVGLETLPKDWIHSTFRVRRQVVFDALSWLKKNNPKYYGDIEISASHIQDLPGDDVPDEIISIIRQSTDVGIINQESDGYVPLDNNEGWLYHLSV